MKHTSNVSERFIYFCAQTICTFNPVASSIIFLSLFIEFIEIRLNWPPGFHENDLRQQESSPGYLHCELTMHDATFKKCFCDNFGHNWRLDTIFYLIQAQQRFFKKQQKCKSSFWLFHFLEMPSKLIFLSKQFCKSSQKGIVTKMMKNIEWEKNYSAKMFWGCERERADSW